jgi:hypothetical protein
MTLVTALYILACAVIVDVVLLTIVAMLLVIGLLRKRD